MANLMDLLQSQVSGQLMDQLTTQVGGTKDQTSTAVESIFTALMTGLSKNVSSPTGANALLGALERDHDGSIFEDLAGFIGGTKSPQNTSMLNSAGILKHVLGGAQGNMVNEISKISGMDQNKVGSLLMSLAPMVLGMLGKVKKEQGLNAGGLSDLITKSTQVVTQKPTANIFTQLLDKDGDGSIVDDLAQSGLKSIMGRLFGRK